MDYIESMIWGHGGTFRRFQGDKQATEKIILEKTHTKFKIARF
jgi:hypothetical protein